MASYFDLKRAAEKMGMKGRDVRELAEQLDNLTLGQQRDFIRQAEELDRLRRERGEWV
jgi:hypothetical protein